MHNSPIYLEGFSSVHKIKFHRHPPQWETSLIISATGMQMHFHHILLLSHCTRQTTLEGGVSVAPKRSLTRLLERFSLGDCFVYTLGYKRLPCTENVELMQHCDCDGGGIEIKWLLYVKIRIYTTAYLQDMFSEEVVLFDCFTLQ